MNVPVVRSGIDRMRDDGFASLRGKRVGLLVNQASVASDLTHTAILLAKADRVDLSAVFAPEHGLWGEVQDMVGKNDGDLRRAIKDARYVVESVARRIDAINENLEGMSRNMLEFSRQIRQSPGLLLNSKPVTDDVQPGGAAQ